ncbi:MAG TPA: M18 family aminopeptidase, partial [Gammaproteobacteria bacterium]
MNEIKFNEGMMDFIQASPTPFHAVEQMVMKLEAAGYQRLYEADAWKLKKGKA